MTKPGLELSDLPASDSRVLGLKACATTVWPNPRFYATKQKLPCVVFQSVYNWVWRYSAWLVFHIPLTSGFSLQVTYAARDAQISVALFLHLLGYPFSRDSYEEESTDQINWQKALERCRNMVDIPFRSKGLGRLVEEVNGEALESQLKPRNRKAKTDRMVPGNNQGRDPRKHKRKPLGVGYSAR